MNWDLVQYKWKELKDKAKEKWGELTNDDLEVIEGNRDQLVVLIQNRYGKAKEEAEKEVEDGKKVFNP